MTQHTPRDTYPALPMKDGMGCFIISAIIVAIAAFALAIAWGLLPFALIVILVTGTCILIGHSIQEGAGAAFGLFVGLLLSAIGSYTFYQHG